MTRTATRFRRGRPWRNTRRFERDSQSVRVAVKPNDGCVRVEATGYCLTMSTEPIEEVRAVFNLLDRWRHFPSDQLERRADIFFALYLPGILKHALGVTVDPRVIPEFPIRKEHSRRSTRADYFLLSKDRSSAFLVELKTEMRSRNRRQDAYLAAARDRGLQQLLSDIPIVAEASKEQAKYVHLLSALEEMGLVALPADIGDYAFPEVRRGITKRIREVQVVASESKVEVVYLQPNESMDDRVISFRAAAEYLDTLDDPFSETFATYVRRWIEPAARRPMSAPRSLVDTAL